MTALPEPWDLSSDAGECRVYAHGAQVVTWTPAGGDPVLWLSPLAQLDSSRAIRGGVPVVFPWFGSGPSGDRSPAHGFARLNSWRASPVERHADAVTMTLSLDSHVVTDEAFPFGYSAALTVTAGEELRIELTVSNTGSESFTFEEALHTYLAVGDVRQVSIDGLDGVDYRDQAAGAATSRARQSGAVRFDGEVDRVYRYGGELQLVDPVLRRALVITTTGSASTVVWNPAEARGATMSDIGPRHWTEFACIEAGNVREDAVRLEPGQSHTLGYAIRVADR